MRSPIVFAIVCALFATALPTVAADDLCSKACVQDPWVEPTSDGIDYGYTVCTLNQCNERTGSVNCGPCGYQDIQIEQHADGSYWLSYNDCSNTGCTHQERRIAPGLPPTGDVVFNESKDANGNTTINVGYCNPSGQCTVKSVVVPNPTSLLPDPNHIEVCFTYNEDALTNACITITPEQRNVPFVGVAPDPKTVYVPTVVPGPSQHVGVCVIGNVCPGADVPTVQQGPPQPEQIPLVSPYLTSLPVPAYGAHGYFEATEVCSLGAQTCGVTF